MSDTFGASLKRMRLRRKMSLVDASRASDISREAVTRYEHLGRFSGQAAKLRKLVEAYHRVRPITADEAQAITDTCDAWEDVLPDLSRPSSAAELTDRLERLIGPDRAAMLIESIIDAIEQRDLVAVRHSNIETKEGDWAVRTYHKRPGA